MEAPQYPTKELIFEPIFPKPIRRFGRIGKILLKFAIPPSLIMGFGINASSYSGASEMLAEGKSIQEVKNYSIVRYVDPLNGPPREHPKIDLESIFRVIGKPGVELAILNHKKANQK